MRSPKMRVDAKISKPVSYSPPSGYHWVLVNNKTKRSASSSNWLLALTAVAVIKNQVIGLPSLLNHVKARKLLIKNSLVLIPERAKAAKAIGGKRRQEAKEFIPTLAVLYGNKLPSHRPPRRQDFCKWVVATMKDGTSKAYEIAEQRKYNEILFNPPRWRWWLSQLGKMGG